jgi:hypothetical protein
MVNKIVNVHATAGFMMQTQLHKIAEHLRVGTLDVSTVTKRLVVWNKDGTTSPVTARIPLNQLKGTIWFLTGMYRNSPRIRKEFKASSTSGRYTCRFNKGIVSFDQEGLNDTEKAVIADIELMDKKSESTHSPEGKKQVA